MPVIHHSHSTPTPLSLFIHYTPIMSHHPSPFPCHFNPHSTPSPCIFHTPPSPFTSHPIFTPSHLFPMSFPLHSHSSSTPTLSSPPHHRTPSHLPLNPHTTFSLHPLYTHHSIAFVTPLPCHTTLAHSLAISSPTPLPHLAYFTPTPFHIHSYSIPFSLHPISFPCHSHSILTHPPLLLSVHHHTTAPHLISQTFHVPSTLPPHFASHSHYTPTPTDTSLQSLMVHSHCTLCSYHTYHPHLTFSFCFLPVLLFLLFSWFLGLLTLFFVFSIDQYIFLYMYRLIVFSCIIHLRSYYYYLCN